jgi:arginase
MIEAGMHINAVGGDCPGKTELHRGVLEKARVVVEFAPQSRIEGEVQQMPPDFAVTELWEVLAGKATGRRDAHEVTVFDSVGFALEDFSALRYLDDHIGAHQAQQIDLVPALDNPKDLVGLASPSSLQGAGKRMNKIRMMGAPTDVGASRRGASMGPAALRVAELQRSLQQHGLEVIDGGDLGGPANPQQPPVQGLRHLEQVVQWNQAVFDAVSGSLAEGEVPLLMGGDHALAVGSIAAVARHCRTHGKDLRVLWLDAHADANTSQSTPTGNIHGMPVACLLGVGPDALTRMGGQTPAMQPQQICQIGIRSVDREEKRHLRELACASSTCATSTNTACAPPCRRRWPAWGRIPTCTSFDVDFLDAALAPGVGTAVLGGPTYREAQLCMEMIADTGRLASLDVMELNPACDVRNQTAEVVVDLVESLFGKSTLIR